MKFLQTISNSGDPLASDIAGPDSSTPEHRIASIPLLPLPQNASVRGRFAFWATDGTSIVVTIWILEETTNTWVKYSKDSVTVTTADCPVVAADPGIALAKNTKVFMQIGTVTGSVTALAWTYT